MNVLLILLTLTVAPDSWKVGEPMLTYWAGPGFPGGGPLDDEAAERLADAGWNVTWCGEKELDTARRHGLLTDPLRLLASLADPKKREELAALVDRVRGHAGLYAYHLVDEPSAAAFPAIAELVTFLRERDPAHPAYVNLLSIYAYNAQFGVEGPQEQAYAEHLRRYVETVKPALLSYDHYYFRVGSDGPQYFVNLAMIRDRARDEGIPFLNVIQASSWTPVDLASPANPRVPDADELRFLVYTTLGYGAQGIS
jgi:hypothetical protein